MENRKFKCYDCGHQWDLPHGNGQMGINLKCPKCNSSNVHRVNGGGYGGRRGLCRSNQSMLREDKN